MSKIVFDYDDLFKKNAIRKYFKILFPFEYWLLKKFFEILETKTDLNDNDAENIKKIIQSGKESGAKEMKINISKEKALGLKGQLNEIDGKVTIGKESESKYYIHVQFE